MNSDGDLLDRVAIWLFAVLFWICVVAVVGLIVLVQVGWGMAILVTGAMTVFLALIFLAFQKSLGIGR